MAAIYDNSAFIHSYQQRSHLTDKDSDEIEVRSVKWSKVLLIVVGVSLVFALGVICALGLLYAGKSRLCDIQKHNDTNLTAELLQKSCISANEMELLSKYNKVKDCLSSCTEFSASSCKLCEEGWTSYAGKCYFFSSEKMTWFEARDSCTALNAHLVTINSKAVQDFLVSKIKETHWIGLNDQEIEGQWVWLNDQTLEETGVKFWFIKKDGTEPDNWDGHNPSGEDCACMGYEGVFLNSWFDASCEYKKKFICEKQFIAFQ
ncbi:C-type lectin domain family 4 member E-like isoform X1 [Paramisgurnus dabryanus]|uniref:C-type lectin domain family 4 member E-like isoform X1 n=1 Tax=Paramisgurnus dabryanus TaxID=90735 RepID=UPI003CCF1619